MASCTLNVWSPLLREVETADGKKYVWCRSKNLKEEWLNYNVTIANWNTAINIAKIKSKSKCLRKEYISKDEQGQEISALRIMVLYQYTANDEFQLELCKVSRQSLREFKRIFNQERRRQGRRQ